MSKYTLNDLLQFLIDQKPLEFQEAFKSVLKDRLNEAVEYKKFTMKLNEATVRDLQAIANLNHMSSYNDTITPGQQISLPDGSIYVVKSGDKLWHIAQGKGKGQYYKPVPSTPSPSTISPDSEKPVFSHPDNMDAVKHDTEAQAAQIRAATGAPEPFRQSEGLMNRLAGARQVASSHFYPQIQNPETRELLNKQFRTDEPVMTSDQIKQNIEAGQKAFDAEWDRKELERQQMAAGHAQRSAPYPERSWMDQYVRIPLAKAGIISNYAAGLEDK